MKNFPGILIWIFAIVLFIFSGILLWKWIDPNGFFRTILFFIVWSFVFSIIQFIPMISLLILEIRSVLIRSLFLIVISGIILGISYYSYVLINPQDFSEKAEKFYNKGEFLKAIEYEEKNKQKAQADYGRESRQYLTSAGNLAEYYLSYGDLKKAEIIVLENIKKHKIFLVLIQLKTIEIVLFWLQFIKEQENI